MEKSNRNEKKTTPFHNEVAKNIYLNKEKKFIFPK